MKIISYNINGIKSATSKGVLQWLKDQDADFVCIQEVRAKEEFAKSVFETPNSQLSLFENSTNYFDTFVKIFNCGNVPGYAGTMILCKQTPNRVVFGLPNDNLDNEGRCITLFYDNFAIVNCYVPNGGTRLEFKMDYFKQLTDYLHNLAKTTPVIFCSDANISHTENDLSHPKECASRTGYLPIERSAMTNLLAEVFCDVVRKFNGNNKVYTWRSYRSINSNIDLYSSKNFGWKYRFDYILVSKELENSATSCLIPDLPYSDHLPIIVELDLK